MNSETVRGKIDITASAIKSRAREYGMNPYSLTEKEASAFAEAQAQEQPNTIAGAFYLVCTDRQWKRVYNRTQRR